MPFRFRQSFPRRFPSAAAKKEESGKKRLFIRGRLWYNFIIILNDKAVRHEADAGLSFFHRQP